jgi:hypothetical protein
MANISDIIDDLFILKNYNSDNGKIIRIKRYKGNYYLFSGIGLLLKYLHDDVWDFKVTITEVKSRIKKSDFIPIQQYPHAKKDCIEDTKQFYAN